MRYTDSIVDLADFRVGEEFGDLIVGELLGMVGELEGFIEFVHDGRVFYRVIWKRGTCGDGRGRGGGVYRRRCD